MSKSSATVVKHYRYSPGSSRIGYERESLSDFGRQLYESVFGDTYEGPEDDLVMCECGMVDRATWEECNDLAFICPDRPD